MTKYKGEMPDFFGERKYLWGRVGPVKTVPVEVTTRKDKENGRWYATIISGPVNIQVLGVEEQLDPLRPNHKELGFETHEDILEAIGRRGVILVQEIIEQTEALAQV